VVTKPFSFEGAKRMALAEKGLAELAEVVDTVVTIPNERLLEVVERGTSFFESFRIADNILRQAVQGISDIITVPGIINRDFSDVRTIMHGMGYAVMGTAVAGGSSAAVEAARKAISSPLLEDASIEGARGILINITGSSKLGLHEVHEASTIIQKAADPDANIIFGAILSDAMGDNVKITVIATGFRSENVGLTKKQLDAGSAAAKEMRAAVHEATAFRHRGERVHEPAARAHAAAAAHHGVPGPLDPDSEEEEPVAEINPNDLDKPAYLRRKLGRD
jgi:cell division protein FtsZ